MLESRRSTAALAEPRARLDRRRRARPAHVAARACRGQRLEHGPRDSREGRRRDDRRARLLRAARRGARAAVLEACCAARARRSATSISARSRSRSCARARSASPRRWSSRRSASRTSRTSGRFRYVNPQLCEMLGYTEQELLAMTVKDISHPGDANVTDDLRDQLRSGAIKSFKMEKRYLRKDGSPIWVGLTIACKRDRARRAACTTSRSSRTSRRASAPRSASSTSRRTTASPACRIA